MEGKNNVIHNSTDKNFDLIKYLKENKENNVGSKQVVFIVGGGPTGLYCGLELLRTNKFIVIISEQRSVYLRQQIFFIQYNNTFRSYGNFSESLKKQLEKKSCNIAQPFISRTYECGGYGDHNDITNNIIAKHVAIKINDFENLLFSEFILNGGIVIKPSLSNRNKISYMYDNTKQKIIGISSSGVLEEDYGSIDRNLIDYMINMSGRPDGSNYIDSGKIINNEPMIDYLAYTKDYIKDNIVTHGKMMVMKPEQPMNDRFLARGLLIFLDIDSLPYSFSEKMKKIKYDIKAETYFDPTYPQNINKNLSIRHYIAQNRYRMFSTASNKYEQFMNHYEKKVTNNSWYISVMLSNEEYNYMRPAIQMFKEHLKLPYEETTDTYKYFEMVLYSCLSFYGILSSDKTDKKILFNALSFSDFPVSLFYSTGHAASFMDPSYDSLYNKENSIKIEENKIKIIAVNNDLDQQTISLTEDKNINNTIPQSNRIENEYINNIIPQSNRIENEYIKNISQSNINNFMAPLPMFAAGDSILGVNYFSGTGLNYGMRSVDHMVNILKKDYDDVTKVKLMNEYVANSNLRNQLNSSLLRFIDFNHITIENIISNNMSFCNTDTTDILLNRINPIEKIVPEKIVDFFRTIDYGLNDVGNTKKEYILNRINSTLITDNISNLLDWLRSIFVYNIKDRKDPKNSFNSEYFDNALSYFTVCQKLWNNTQKISFLLNILSTFVESNMMEAQKVGDARCANSPPISNDHLITLNDVKNILASDANYGIKEDELITIKQEDKPILSLVLDSHDNINDMKDDIKAMDHTKDMKVQMEQYVDKYEKYKSVMTSFVTDNMINFDEIIDMINTEFDNAIENYVKYVGNNKDKYPCNANEILPSTYNIIFLNKGGNIMRFIFYSYLTDAKKSFVRKLKEVYGNDFAMSDMDFTISVAKNVCSRDLIISELTKISFITLQAIRNILFAYITKYFKFFGSSSSTQTQNLLDKIKDLSEINKEIKILNVQFNNIASNDYNGIPANRTDILIFNEGNNLKIGNIKNPSAIYPERHFAYISINNTIPTFVLIRMKINFVCNYVSINNSKKIKNVSIPGELIDVSISKVYTDGDPAKDTHESVQIYKHGNKSIRSYDIIFLIKDLAFVLYIQKPEVHPEDISKKEKRIRRLIILSFIDAHINSKKTMENIDTVIVSYAKCADDLMYRITDEKKIDNITFDELISLIKTYEDYKGFSIFFRKLRESLIHFKDDWKKASDHLKLCSDELKKFSAIIATESKENTTYDLYTIPEKFGGSREIYMRNKKKYNMLNILSA